VLNEACPLAAVSKKERKKKLPKMNELEDTLSRIHVEQKENAEKLKALDGLLSRLEDKLRQRSAAAERASMSATAANVFLNDENFHIRLMAAVKIQRWFRSKRLQGQWIQLIEAIQSARGQRTLLAAWQIERKRERAALRIQRVWRRYKIRCMWVQMIESCTNLKHSSLGSTFSASRQSGEKWAVSFQDQESESDDDDEDEDEDEADDNFKAKRDVFMQSCARLNSVMSGKNGKRSVRNDRSRLLFCTEEDDDELIRGGTVVALVEMLLDPDYERDDYEREFLLSFGDFVSPPRFLQLLIRRYGAEAVAEQQQALSRDLAIVTVAPVQMRVLGVLKQWVRLRYEHFMRDGKLEVAVRSFLADVVSSGRFRGHAESILSVMAQRRAQFDSDASAGVMSAAEHLLYLAKAPRVKLAPSTSSSSNTIQRRRPRSFFGAALHRDSSLGNVGSSSSTAAAAGDDDDHLLMFDAEEVARQMTLIDWSLLRCVHLEEFFGQRFGKRQKHVLAPNLIELGERFSALSGHLATRIVRLPTPKLRGKLIAHLIGAGDRLLRTHRNYHGALCVMTALEHTAIGRLKLSWAHVHKKSMSLYRTLCDTMTPLGNHSTYRAAYRAAPTPRIPAIPTLLHDLVMLDEGNPDTIESAPVGRRRRTRTLVNFVKRRVMAHIVDQVADAQQHVYCLRPYPRLQKLLLRTDVLDERTLYAESLRIEPRAASSSSSSLAASSASSTSSALTESITPLSASTPVRSNSDAGAMVSSPSKSLRQLYLTPSWRSGWESFAGMPSSAAESPRAVDAAKEQSDGTVDAAATAAPLSPKRMRRRSATLRNLRQARSKSPSSRRRRRSRSPRAAHRTPSETSLTQSQEVEPAPTNDALLLGRPRAASVASP
jgi:RasGEF domain/RasGEF N-terminal motif/IQ calmodulin-binding motif